MFKLKETALKIVLLVYTKSYSHNKEKKYVSDKRNSLRVLIVMLS